MICFATNGKGRRNLRNNKMILHNHHFGDSHGKVAFDFEGLALKALLLAERLKRGLIDGSDVCAELVKAAQDCCDTPRRAKPVDDGYGQ